MQVFAILSLTGVPAALLAQTATPQGTGVAQIDPSLPVAGANLSYTGSLFQVGIGIDRDNRLRGQASQVLDESQSSATIGQAWLGNGAGGLRLDYNWLPEKEGQTDPSSLVRKVFFALDRNRENDRKLTLGGGLESECWFGGLNLSRGLSGRRLTGAPSISEVTTTNGGFDNGRPYIDTTTTTTTTQYYQQVYDYGIGLRAGTYLTEAQLRLAVGFDREWGDFSSRQNTYSLSIDKYFSGSPHSLGLLLERFSKSGDFEIGHGSGTRAMLMYRYNFGGNSLAQASGWRETRSVGQQSAPAKLEPQPPQKAAPIVEMRKETRIVKTTATMTSDAFFDLDKAELTPLAKRELDKVILKLKHTDLAGNIRLSGHTCDLGGDAYNLRLSERRALAVRDYLVRNGFRADQFVAEGLGKRQPKYPNTPATRASNRRVDLEFIEYRDKSEIVEIPVEVSPAQATPISPVTWHAEVVEQEPAWARRALRNTLPHKQTVDSYRGARISQGVRTTRTWVNRMPVAQDDVVTVSQDSSATIGVMSNDKDPDGDTLTLVAVGQAAHGSAVITGNAIRYTPVPGYRGTDAFTYTVGDGNGGTATATVRVTVAPINHAPVAVDDRFTVGYAGDWPLEVLANDRDADGDALSIVSFTQPSGGVGTVVREGNHLVFKGQERFSQSTFTYTISDGQGGTATATVTLIDP